MRILIDILHPAHVHFFRLFHKEMQRRGHDVLVTARDKDVTLDLLKSYSIRHNVLSRQRTGRAGLAWELLSRTKRLSHVVRRCKPDVLIGIMGPSIALAGKALRVPTVVFYDTETARRSNRFAYPLASVVVTPDSYEAKVRGIHITYPGYHELAYLHPNRFTPDKSRLASFDLHPPYSVVRFTSWQASHDIGTSGLTLDHKLQLIDHLAEVGQVVVSSEGTLPEQLEPFRLKGPIADIHHVLAFADLVIGESGTMSSEAAVLGVPAIFIHRRSLGYLAELERRYGLVQRFSPDDLGSITAAIDSITANGPPPGAHDRLLSEKIDVTDWMLDFIPAWISGSRRVQP